MLRSIAIAVAGLAAGGASYVRFAPVDALAYHVPPVARVEGDSGTVNGFTAARRITLPPSDLLRTVRTLARDQPRTTLVAGSVTDGLMTFETRSAVMGYPDFTTVTVTDATPPLLVIEARSHYGKGDMGVNRARVRDWLARLGPLVAPLP